jgi:putative permease
MEFLLNWFQRNFSNPQAVMLAFVLAMGLLGIVFLGQILAPLIAALVIAYVLDSPTESLHRAGAPRIVAVSVSCITFLSLIIFAMVAVVPLLSEQLTQLVVALPNMLSSIQVLLLELPERYPDLVSSAQITELMGRLRGELLSMGQILLVVSVDRIGNVITVLIYLFLVPFMVFFFLKDKRKIQDWFMRFLPSDRGLVNIVWHEVDHKTGAYVRGKIYEVGIVGGVAWATFGLIGLDFDMLLAALTGLSVLVPYIGVAVVSIPVTLVAFFQFGASGEFAAALGAYTVIQVLDGNLLAPLLISEVVDLHPIAVIAAILIFGGFWGFWGVFFSIPLATVAVAVQNAWPDPDELPQGDPPETEAD